MKGFAQSHILKQKQKETRLFYIHKAMQASTKTYFSLTVQFLSFIHKLFPK